MNDYTFELLKKDVCRKGLMQKIKYVFAKESIGRQSWL